MASDQRQQGQRRRLLAGTVIALLSLTLIGGSALLGSLSDVATHFVDLRDAGAVSDVSRDHHRAGHRGLGGARPRAGGQDRSDLEDVQRQVREHLERAGDIG